mmetsp:Transcript_87640/g.169828  ORF Transcript_87640/g.169828 Transcript_87640/m.169828 type:complete len:86 (-) Transcript_87640:330-587(-)
MTKQAKQKFRPPYSPPEPEPKLSENGELPLIYSLSHIQYIRRFLHKPELLLDEARYVRDKQKRSATKKAESPERGEEERGRGGER